MDTGKLRQFLREMLVDEEAEMQNDKETQIEKKIPEYIDNCQKYVDGLKKSMQLLQSKHSFKVGDIVVWKEGLKNRRFPENQQPGIVLKVYEKPISDDDPDVGEEYDIQLGFIADENLFLAFNFNGSRFKELHIP